MKKVKPAFQVPCNKQQFRKDFFSSSKLFFIQKSLTVKSLASTVETIEKVLFINYSSLLFYFWFFINDKREFILQKVLCYFLLNFCSGVTVETTKTFLLKSFHETI